MNNNEKKDRIKSYIRYVSLHSHTNGSIYDGLGYPEEHMDYAYSRGIDSMAITDHGNCSILPYQMFHAQNMNKEGRKFKPIFGSEIYFIPSIEEWKKDHEYLIKNKSISKEEKDLRKKELHRKYHMLLLAKNREGLKNIFKIISISNTGDYFYRFQRADYNLLRKYSKGIIASSACIGGVYSQNYWKNRGEQETVDEEEVYRKMIETSKMMIDIFGKENWYGELQWHNLLHQHKMNTFVIEVSKELGFELISTADSHYPKPSQWKDREVYKRLGWMGGKEEKPEYLKEDKLPETIEEMGFELYVKNGDQIWESYKKTSRQNNFSYNDELIRRSIEKTYDIAFNQIEDFYPNIEIKLPSFVIPEGETEEYALSRMCIEGLKKLELNKKKNYVNRLKNELEVIKDRGFCKYFLTMKRISDEAQETQLIGPGRGSVAGSLVSYVLNITQVDPIKNDLLFERFMTKDEEEKCGIVEENNINGEETLVTIIEGESGERVMVSSNCFVEIIRDTKKIFIKMTDLIEGDLIL